MLKKHSTNMSFHKTLLQRVRELCVFINIVSTSVYLYDIILPEDTVKSKKVIRETNRK